MTVTFIKLRDHVASQFTFAYEISQGNNVVWFVNRQAGIIKFLINGEFIGKNCLPVFYKKSKIKVTTYDVLNNFKMIQDNKEYILDSFFKECSSFGYFFFKKKYAMYYMLDKIKNKNINPKAKKYIENNPQYFI